MPSLTALLRHLLTNHTDDVVVECRHCGASLDDGHSQCPHCGSDESIQYEFN